MKQFISILGFFFAGIFTVAAQSDSIIISGTFANNTKYSSVILNRFGVGEHTISKTNIKDNSMKIALPSNIPAGIYRLRFSQVEFDKYIDLVIDKETEIDFSLDLNKIPLIPGLSKSVYNKNWATYNSEIYAEMNSMSILGEFINSYKLVDEKVYKEAVATYDVKKQAITKLQSDLIKNNKNSFLSLYMTNNPLWFPNPKDDIILQKFEKKNHIWDHVDTNNLLLLNSPLYTDKIFENAKYYLDPDIHFSKNQSDDGLKKVTDELMQSFGRNPQTGRFAMELMYTGFKQLDNEVLLQYIDQNYRQKFGSNDTESTQTLEERLKVYNRLKEGAIAPEITFPMGNTIFKLSELKSPYTVVVFWASWCPYCEKALPELESVASKNKAIKVVAISLDENQSAFDISKSKFPSMIHYSDLKKLNSPIAVDYNINATPSFFLLDSNKKIIGKFSNVTDLLAGVKL